jgi:hypothetical protein
MPTTEQQRGNSHRSLRHWNGSVWEGIDARCLSTSLEEKASRLLSTAAWLVNPLQRRSGNAANVIETRAAFRPHFVGGSSGPMLLSRMPMQYRNAGKSIAAEAAPTIQEAPRPPEVLTIGGKRILKVELG